MVNKRELKAILKEKKIDFYSYWDKKRLLALVNKHDLLPKKASEKEKIIYPKYDRLKMIKQNSRKVSQEDVETGKIKTFPSIYKAAKFIDRAPMTISNWDGEVWENKYKAVVE